MPALIFCLGSTFTTNSEGAYKRRRMTTPYFSGETLDDLMRSVIEGILENGNLINPTKGLAVELTGALLELTNPRARLSRTESRGKLFSSIGELCWYLAKDNSLEFIYYYIPKYQEFADNSEIHGGYGPRLFNWDGINQVNNIISLLKRNPATRKAVIQIFDRQDIINIHKDVACTCTLQFMIRDRALHLITFMRSNDVFLGLPHDIFCFTMLQEIIARTLSVHLGTYKHAVGSLHLYEKNSEAAKQFINEGWQSTTTLMPPMPKGDPWAGIYALLNAEHAIRVDEPFEISDVGGVEEYWLDLMRLLKIFKHKKNQSARMIQSQREDIYYTGYNSFIDKVLSDFE